MALAAGFDDAGAAMAVRLDKDEEYLNLWLEKGYNGSMEYMEREKEKRVDPSALVPGCKTVLVCILNYYKEVEHNNQSLFVSQSGLSVIDYHLAVKSRLKKLEQLIVEAEGDEAFSQDHQHLFCDSAPILERRWAVKAGLGWIGKNKQFIHPVLGSFVHIGILLTNIEIQNVNQKIIADKCAECDICIRKCPTGALRSDMFDARKCVAYLTIERKEPLNDKYKAAVRNVLYGCDTCANVCPYNQHLVSNKHEDLQVNSQLLNMSLEEWNDLSNRKKNKLLHRLAK